MEETTVSLRVEPLPGISGLKQSLLRLIYFLTIYMLLDTFALSVP